MLSASDRKQLLDIARRSIQHGLETGTPLKVDLQPLTPPLREPGASFVTLERHGQLRGCIGTLEAHQPLAVDVAQNAFQSAFRDPRFPPLEKSEWTGLDIHISVLSKPEPMQFSSEEDFIRQLRPGVDGVILAEGWHRGTFLPAVWDDLPDPHDFVRHLKLKAGLPVDYWSDSIKAYRYTAEYFP